jgi:hypothetical protein|mmetsp:Transcript_9787/g.14149  ORF Transcript_9787/g.14149 Transcript_9787/m.14149 type:complete len:85 (-) Transcript_9787:428-682(-)
MLHESLYCERADTVAAPRKPEHSTTSPIVLGVRKKASGEGSMHTLHFSCGFWVLKEANSILDNPPQKNNVILPAFHNFQILPVS